MSPARAGSGSTPPRGCSRAKGIFPWRPPPVRSSAAPISGGHEPAEVEFSFHMAVTRVAETPRATKPYAEEQWTEILRAGHDVDRRLDGAGRPPDHGRRTDLRGRRRSRRRRMEHRRRRPHQAALRRRSHPPPAPPLRPGRTAPFRPGQMVSGRAVAALGVRRCTGGATASRCGSNEDLVANCAEPDNPTVGARPRLHGGAVRNPGPAARTAPFRPTRTPPICCSSSRACPSTSIRGLARLENSAERERLIRALERGIDNAHGLCPAHPALAIPRAGPPLDDRTLEVSPQTAVPAARRLAGGLPSAAGRPALSGAAKTFPTSFRSIRSPLTPRRPPARPCSRDRRARHDPGDAGGGARLAAPIVPPLPFPNEVRGRPHRAFGGAAQRRAVRVHAPAGRRRRLRRPLGRHRGSRPRHRPQGPYRRLRAALRSQSRRHQGHARPWRHRSEHPARAELAGGHRHHHGPLRRGPSVRPGRAEIHGGRAPHRNRRRQSHRARRRHATRQPVPAQARPARQPDRVLAEPPVPVVSLLGAVHRPDQSGAAHRRGPPRSALRAGNRPAASPGPRQTAAPVPPWLVDRAVPQSA